MRRLILARFSLALLTALVVFSFSSSAFGAATIVIQNNDGANVGFNDPTPVAPVGGNPGTTLGQQRLNAFQFAANIWGASLESNSTISVRADWQALSCTSNSAVLGAAGAASIWRDFPAAPFSATWYSAALANALSAGDLDAGNPEINAHFNVNLGNPGCLDGIHFYLGLDNNHGNDTDLVTVLIHEFSHGLGFQTFTSSSTGAQNSGFPSIYDRFLLDGTTGKTWTQMTDAERQASALNTGNLAWSGPAVTYQIHNVLATPRLTVNSPGAIAGNYAVGPASFGPSLSSPGVTATVVQALDPSDGAGVLTTDACSPLTNAAAVSGKIALIDRGTCLFVTKVKNAQNAGAVGVVIADNAAGSPPPGLGGSDATITIPAVRITQADGDTIKAQLGAGVNATLLLDHSIPGGADPQGRALLFAPNPVQAGSSVSHWDTNAFPNQLMEPNITGDLTHSVTTPQDLTASLLQDVGWVTITPPPAPNTAQFNGSGQTVTETLNQTTKIDLTVTRTGDTSGAATIDYASANGTASERSDYLAALGTLHFFAGETSKTIPVFIVDDRFGESPETFTVNLTNPVGCTLGSPVTFTVTINSDEAVNGLNPVKDASFDSDFFVRQHYLDFLNREPDPPGLAFWKDQIDSCTTQECREIRRINVSAAFFLSIEFQQTGYLVERLYKAAYGSAQGTSTLGGVHQLPVPIVRLNEFLADTQRMGRGVIIGAPGADQLLENNKQTLIAEFVQRSRFTTAFPNSVTPAQFVDTLNTNAGGPLSQGERDQLVSNLTSGAKTRAQVLRAVAEDPDLFAAESNQAFVLAQYFGYLRRDPNASPDLDYTGYDFWLGKLNQFNGNFVNAEMVKAFIVSGEYQGRFGP